MVDSRADQRPAPPTRRIAGITFGTGSESGSLAAAILSAVLIPGVLLIAVFALIDRAYGLAVVGVAATLAIALIAALGFVNYGVMRSERLSRHR